MPGKIMHETAEAAPEPASEARSAPECHKLLWTLERLLAIEAVEVKEALNEASHMVAEALGAEKIDAFLYKPTIDSLVAEGTSDTPMARRQKSLGLDHLPLSNGGRAAEVFQTGRPFITRRSDEDARELPGIKHSLGVRSTVAVPLELNGERRGVLSANSAQPEAFSQGDLQFLQAVSHWVGMVLHRAELVEQITQEAVEQAKRIAAEELVTILAHDLKNYITPLKGWIDLLRRRSRRDGRAQDLQDAEQAANALGRLQKLIDDLLDTERIEQGIFALSLQPVDLPALVRDTVRMLSPRGRQIELRVQVPDSETLIVEADPNRIRQALENLLSNALKYSPQGAAVAVEVHREKRDDGEWATIMVRDRGPGMSPELLPRLFTRFTSDATSGGLGLGLYLAHRIAAAHGGDLAVESTPGAGATFRLSLPLA
jgi:two-component system OmpR family sensor kinase